MSQEAAIEQALQAQLPAGWGVRARTETDLPFLARLYANTREEELQPVPWPPQQKADFLQDQFAKQHQHYLQHYPLARWLVLEAAGQPAGRVYVEQTAREIRLMDVALLAAHRNQGVGSALMAGLLRHADAAGLPVTLHVEPFNPALRLYQRLGFEERETRGYYLFMERQPALAVLS